MTNDEPRALSSDSWTGGPVHEKKPRWERRFDSWTRVHPIAFIAIASAVMSLFKTFSRIGISDWRRALALFAIGSVAYGIVYGGVVFGGMTYAKLVGKLDRFALRDLNGPMKGYVAGLLVTGAFVSMFAAPFLLIALAWLVGKLT